MIVTLVLLNVCLNVLGQLLLKTGVNRLGELEIQNLVLFFYHAFTSPLVLGGLFLYFSSFLVWLILLTKVDLSFAYPTISLSYVLILLTSWVLLHETISSVRVLGVAFITLGVLLVFRS